MKNRGILYFLAVGALTAAPVFADKIPDASMERESKMFSTGGIASVNSFRDAATGRSAGPDAFKLSNPASHMRDFDEVGKLAVMSVRPSVGPVAGSSAGIGEVNFLPVASTEHKGIEKHDNKGGVKHDPVGAVDDDESSLPPVAVPEPEAFTLVLVGVGILGMLLYRRNSL